MDLAKQFPEFEFVGIDLKEVTGMHLPNWTQLRNNFVHGLRRLRPKSVDLISSEMALGFYGSKPMGVSDVKSEDYKKHTLQATRLAFSRLKPGGKLMVSVTKDVLANTLNAIEHAGFDRAKVSTWKMSEKELQRTRYLREHGKSVNMRHKVKFYQIVAEK